MDLEGRVKWQYQAVNRCYRLLTMVMMTALRACTFVEGYNVLFLERGLLLCRTFR